MLSLISHRSVTLPLTVKTPLFLNSNRAYDATCHDIIIKTTEMFGIIPNLLSLFTSHISDMSQIVQIDGKKSAGFAITCGVPQGSVLSPMPFIIYTNDFRAGG